MAHRLSKRQFSQTSSARAGGVPGSMATAEHTPMAPPKPAGIAPTNGKRPTPEERRAMIATAAYFRAERRGFQGGNPAEDWMIATKEIDEMLAKRK